MKKTRTLLSILMLLALYWTATAQEYNMEINHRDGTVTSIPTEDVVNVTFGETSPLPGDAGNIKAVPDGIGGYSLTIKPISNATSYRWIKDGKTVQESTAFSYYANESGKYSVVGVNDMGEGKASPEIQVTPITTVFNILTDEFIPDGILREHIRETYAGGGESLTNLQAAAIGGGFYLPVGIETLRGIEYFCGLDSILNFTFNSDITEIDLSRNVSLKKVFLENLYNLENLNLEGLNELESLDISWTALMKYDVNKLPVGMKHLGLGALGYQSFDCRRFESLEELIINGNELTGTFDASGLKHLHRLQLQGNSKLTGVDVTGCISLKNLNVASCSSLTDLDVTTCSALERLYTQFTSLGNTDLSTQRYNLKAYVPQGSQLDILDLKGMRNLEVCQAGDCLLKEMPDFSDCVSLKNLRMENSGIKGPVDVNVCKNMADINIYRSNITSIALEDMPALWNVNLFSNPELTQLDLRNLPAVQQLSCYDLPKIERVDISTVNPRAAIYLTLCPNLKEIKVWPDFDIDNPPTNVVKDETARFVYEFTD